MSERPANEVGADEETDDDSWEHFLQESKNNFLSTYYGNVKSNAVIDDFTLIQNIAEGRFSVLTISQMKTNEKMYLMEVYNKEYLAETDSIKTVLEEKKIMRALNFRFFVKLLYTFQDNCNLFKCMSFANGGFLLTHLKNFKKFQEVECRFLTAQLVLALEYLHYMGLVFRNLSAANILLDKRGYLKLYGFSFCKRLSGRTYTFCGTLDYLAPEVLRLGGYGQGVDWWALGVLLYELGAGYLPFPGSSEDEICMKILEGGYDLPEGLTLLQRTLLHTLLEPDLTLRCCSTLYANPAASIKAHPWFQEMNWAALVKRELPAPFVPKVCGPDDVSHFPVLKHKPLEFSEFNEYSKYFSDY